MTNHQLFSYEHHLPSRMCRGTGPENRGHFSGSLLCFHSLTLFREFILVHLATIIKKPASPIIDQFLSFF